MATVTGKKNSKKGQAPTKKPITNSTFSGKNDGDDGDDGNNGNYETDEGDENDMKGIEITQEEREQHEKTQAEGAANAGNGSEMEKPPPYILKYYKELYPTFDEFWTTKASFSEKTSEESNHTIEKLINANGGSLSQIVAKVPFSSFIEVKKNALAHFKNLPGTDESTRLKAWSDADKEVTKMRHELELTGYPKEFGPPEDWIEQITGLKRSGDETDESDNSSTTSDNETTVTSISNERWDPDADDSIEGLSRACGAKLPLLSMDGEVCGYSRRGGYFEILLKQGKDSNVRYRLVPAKAVIAFDPSNPTGQNLAVNQRGSERDPKTGTKKWHAKHVVALKAVAWRQDEADGDDPIKVMRHTGEGQQSFPVTRVKILWNDNKETWETRTTLRALYPRETADAMIYQRAGIQEARYRRGQGLPDLAFKRIKLPSIAPAFSTSSRASGWSSRKSRNVAASRVSFDDDEEEEEESESGAFSKAQQEQLEKMFQSLMSTFLTKSR